MKKAYSLSSIAIVAVVGVALVLAWMNYQSTAGVNYTERVVENQDSLRSKMETVKSMSEPLLEHASTGAALTVAKAGGGMGTERVWNYNGIMDPPTFHEVMYSLSNQTLNNLNAYLDDSTEIYEVLNVKIDPYKCSGIYPEVAPQCPQTDYPEACDGWDVIGLGGSFYSIEDETTHKYLGDIEGTVESNRFFWMYYRLIEAEIEDSIIMDIKDLHDQITDCDPETDQSCVDIEVCRHDNGNGDECVNYCVDGYNGVTCENILDPEGCDLETDTNCTETEVCTSEDGTPCDNPCIDGTGDVVCTDEINPNCCCINTGDINGVFNSVTGDAAFYGHFDEYVTCTVEKECVDTHSISIKITCVDEKYKIPGDDETGEKYLTWVIREMIAIGCDYSTCIGGSVLPVDPIAPPVHMSGYNTAHENEEADLFFAVNEDAYCSGNLKCFDQGYQIEPFEGEMCFDP